MIYDGRPEDRSHVARIMETSPQPWNVKKILEDGAGQVLLSGERQACLRLANFYFLEGGVDGNFLADLVPLMGRDGYVISSDPGWYAALDRAGVAGQITDRTIFLWNGDSSAIDAVMRAGPPAGVSIRPLRFDDVGIIKTLDWADDVFDAFGDERDLERRGFGVVAVKDGRIVSLCVSFAVTAQHVEIEIDTDPACRGLGLAGVVGAHFLAESLRRGLLPIWDSSHETSSRLAEKLGLKRDRDYSAWRFPA